MLKCVCGEHIKHTSNVEQMHAINMRCVHNGLSDIGILSSQNLWKFIGLFDRNRLPTAELDRHYLQNGRTKHI